MSRDQLYSLVFSEVVNDAVEAYRTDEVHRAQVDKLLDAFLEVSVDYPIEIIAGVCVGVLNSITLNLAPTIEKAAEEEVH